jgi:capsular exopolysaccharide synthesis family protein
MGFFYQALKKAAGVETSPAEELAEGTRLDVVDEPRRETPVQEPLAPKPRRKFSLKYPIESLVAFLAPPVKDENVIAMEQCRVLRARIWETMRKKNLKSLLMTSAMPAEGKTLMSVNLAFALSQIEGVRVLLVGVDMRRPSLAEFLDISPDKGLNTFIQNGDSFDDVCWELSPTLDIVPTLMVEENSAELLHGQQMIEFLAEAKRRYDVIVMDGPPMFPIVDAQVLTPLVDAAVLIVRAGKTPYELSRQGADLLKGKLIGTILNGATTNKQSGYYGGYYGRYGKAKKKK